MNKEAQCKLICVVTILILIDGFLQFLNSDDYLKGKKKSQSLF